MGQLIPNNKSLNISEYPLAVINDPRGAIFKMFKKGSHSQEPIEEVYCSEILPGQIKAWKRHKVLVQNLVVPRGEIELVVYNPNLALADSARIRRIRMGYPGCYKLVSLPAGLWYGFRCLSKSPALIVNCISRVYDDGEVERLAHDDLQIPFSWRQDD